MAKFMIECLKESPEVCNKLSSSNNTAEDLIKYYLEVAPSKLILIGSGSSNNIAQCSKQVLKKFLKVNVEIYTPIQFAMYETECHEGALILCLSQSGRSTNTIEALEAAKQKGYKTAALTMVPNSPLSIHCEHVFEYGTYTGEQDSFVCRGFSASVTYFSIFAIKIALKKNYIKQNEYEKLIKDLLKITNSMSSLTTKTEIFFQDNKKDLFATHRNMVMGMGNSSGIASESTLKFSETTGIPTNGYETEEFLHGPAFEVKKDHALFIYDIDTKTHKRTLTIYEACKELCNRVYLISRFSDYGDNTIYFDINVEESLLPILFVIPVQMLPGRICEELGIRAITINNYRASQIAVSKTDR